jgi:hypothetical protein
LRIRTFAPSFKRIQMTRRPSFYLAATLLVSGCGGSPTAPSAADRENGVTIYADPRLRGRSELLLKDIEDLDDLKNGCDKGGILHPLNFDDCISSIHVPQGFRVTVYEDPRYRGDSVTFTSDVQDLDDVKGPCGGDFDDCISSIRISRQ